MCNLLITVLAVQCFTQESVDLMGRIIYGPHVGVGDIAGVGPGGPSSIHDVFGFLDKALHGNAPRKVLDLLKLISRRANYWNSWNIILKLYSDVK
jgi:hypothetical protein